MKILDLLKSVRAKILGVLGLAGITMMLAAPASATCVSGCDENGSLGMPTANMVFLDFSGGLAGFGEVLAGSLGDVTHAQTGVDKFSHLVMDGGIWGSDDGCESDCGQTGGWFSGNIGEAIYTSGWTMGESWNDTGEGAQSGSRIDNSSALAGQLQAMIGFISVPMDTGSSD